MFMSNPKSKTYIFHNHQELVQNEFSNVIFFLFKTLSKLGASEGLQFFGACVKTIQ